MNRTVVVVAVVAAVVGALTGGLIASRNSAQSGAEQPVQQTLPGTTPKPAFVALKTYPQPRVVADFALVDQMGEPFNLAKWQTRWNLVFFGFTHCPDICPSTMALMSEVTQQAALGDQLGVTFISVDPERDTPKHLADYVGFFDPGFLAVTGPPAQLVALTHQMGVLFDIQPHEAGTTVYNVDHSAAVLLINPQGQLVGQFPAPHNSDAMVADLQRMIDG